MSAKLTKVMLEADMGDYLSENGYDIYDSENCIDSVLVSDFAIDTLGYESYLLNGYGNYNETILFILKI
jgi:hypothetical protein